MLNYHFSHPKLRKSYFAPLQTSDTLAGTTCSAPKLVSVPRRSNHCIRQVSYSSKRQRLLAFANETYSANNVFVYLLDVVSLSFIDAKFLELFLFLKSTSMRIQRRRRLWIQLRLERRSDDLNDIVHFIDCIFHNTTKHTTFIAGYIAFLRIVERTMGLRSWSLRTNGKRVHFSSRSLCLFDATWIWWCSREWYRHLCCH